MSGQALTQTALSRMDLAPVADAVVQQIDLTQFVLDNVDLERVVRGALTQLDLTAIVVGQVDLAAVVGAALQRLDLTQIVLTQVDLLGVAEYVVDGIDLPEIIRDSTGSMASETVRSLRMQGVEGDAAVARIVDRVLHRRQPRQPEPRVGGRTTSETSPGDLGTETNP